MFFVFSLDREDSDSQKKTQLFFAAGRTDLLTDSEIPQSLN